MSRAGHVQRQKDCMTQAIDAHQRGDTQHFRGAVNELVRAGKAMGIEPSREAGPLPVHKRRGGGQIVEPKARRSRRMFFT